MPPMVTQVARLLLTAGHNKMQRRDLIKLAAAGIMMPAASLLSACSGKYNSRYFSALRKSGQDHIAGFNHLGELDFLTTVPERCHGGAYSSALQHLAWPARSPGNHLYILNDTGDLIQTVTADAGQHFYGHAQYTSDGRYLFTSENHFADGAGRIVVRDAAQKYKVVNSLYSGGIGPHELRLMSDGKHLLVANGGILTHPKKSGKLNLASMKPNLSIVDSDSGKVIQRLELPDHQLSIRHLALNKKDQLVVLTQYQGSSGHDLPLLYKWQPGQKELEPLATPQQENQHLDQSWPGYQHYMASGELTDSGILAATTPKGNRIGYWDINQNRFIAQYAMKDVAGIALSKNGRYFIASSGRGRLWQFDANTALPLTDTAVHTSGIGWDNHMLMV